MGKKYVITQKQLTEYVEKKRADKTFYDILESLYKNKRYLKEDTLKGKANQTVINDYKRKNLITPMVHEMLIKFNVIDENYEIIQ